MRKRMILFAFILLLNTGSVFADLPAIKSPPPVKEEQKQGICFSPTAIAGVLFSLSLIAFGLRFIRKREIQADAQETAE